MIRFTLLYVTLLIFGCSKDNEPKEPAVDPRAVELQELFDDNCAEVLKFVDTDGWLLPDDGDGMLWSGMLGAVPTCLTAFNAAAAEWPDQPGRFDRAPPAGSVTSDNPDWCSWSRDMQKGFLWWAWRTRSVDVVLRHIEYGRKNNWVMGLPFGDGRCLYTPSAIGLNYQVTWGLGAPDDPSRLWPDIYSSGLDDYQAHIQVKNIVLRGEVEEARRNDGDAYPDNPDDPPVVDEGGSFGLVDVDDTQLDRLKEHAEREPKCGFFTAAYGVYTGDFSPAFAALLAPDQKCSYVRCNNPRACYLADWLFAADLVLRRYK